jgi:hypothetical protein
MRAVHPSRRAQERAPQDDGGNVDAPYLAASTRFNPMIAGSAPVG